MNDWWKSPVLQGPENDYGDYDYLIEELPQDYAKWELSKDKWHCESCGKNSHLLFKTVHHFYSLDGYDSMSYDECWKCRLSTKIYSVKHNLKRKLKKPIKVLKAAMELHSMVPNISFSKCYGFAKEIEK